MNILHITTELGFGGIEQLISNLAELQIKRGHKIRVLTICKTGKHKDDLENVGAGVDCYGAQGNWKKKAPFFCLWLKKYLHRNKVEGVFEHCSSDGYISLVCASASVPYMVSVIHSTYRFRFRRRIEYRLQHRLFLNYYSHFVAVSESVRRFEITHFGIPHNRISVIHNGIVLERFARSNASLDKKKKLLGIPLKGNEIIVGAVGNLRPEKNHGLLLRSWALLTSQCPTVLKLIIVGDGDKRRELEAQRDSLGLNDSVVFLGSRTDVPELLTCFDIYASSSKHEGHPVAVLEAMATKLPVVATNVEGLRDVVRHGVNGFLVDPENPSSFAEGLRMLIANKGLRRSMGQAACDFVRKSFSIERCERLYEQVLLESRLRSGVCGITI